MHWYCHKCGSKVDFEGQMRSLFDEKGKAVFDPRIGAFMHTIECRCDARWKIYMVGQIRGGAR